MEVVVDCLAGFGGCCPLFLDQAIAVLLHFLVGFNQHDRLSLSFALGFPQQVLAVSLHVLLLLAHALHFLLELDGGLFDLPLVHTEHILELLELFQLLLVFFQVQHDAVEDVHCALDLSVSQLSVHIGVRVVCPLVLLTRFHLSDVVLVLVQRRLLLFDVDQFVVDVLQVFQAGNRVLLVLSIALLLESIVRNPQHL